LALLSGARQRIGFYASDGKLWRNRVFTHLAHLAGKPGQHMAEYYLSLLLAYNLKTENDSPEMVIPEQKRRLAVALFKKEKIPSGLPVVAVQPFSLWQYKEWGTDKYVELINRIRLEYKLPVIITGSPDETGRAEEMVKMCGENVFNFAGKTSIGIHVAAALGTPTVSIFGPTSFEVWGPRGKQHCVVQKDISCVPCSEKGCQGNEVSDCLEELTVDEAMPSVKRQIEKILAV
jgi:ADP-heptose:LPS heptosyltransferase